MIPRAAPRHRSGKARRWWLVAGVLLAGAVVVGPTIVGYTPLPNSLLAAQLPPEAGRLTTQGATLGWTGPLALSGVELRDPSGVSLFSAEKIEIDSGLLGLLSGDSGRLGVRVERPRIDLVVTPTGSNFDAVIAAVQRKADEAAAQQPAGSPAAKRPIAVEVVDAAVRVTDSVTKQSWIADGVGATIRGINEGVDALDVEASGALKVNVAAGVPPPPTGSFNVRVGLAEGGGRLARATASSVPVSIVGPLLRRSDPQAAVDGWASLEGEAAWNAASAAGPPPANAAEVVRDLLAAGFRTSGEVTLTGVEYLGAATDRAPVRIGTIAGPWRVAAADDRLRIDSIEARSEVGSATLSGQLSLAEIERWLAGVASAPTDLRADAQVDFGRLAAVAPQLVRLRQGTRIDSGNLQASVRSEAGRVSATLATGALSGVSDGRRIAWREPLDVRVVAAQRGAGLALTSWALEDLQAKSSFFQAAASGDAARLEGRVQIDLDRLAGELAPIVDLGSTQIAGRGDARFTVRRNEAAGRWRLDAAGDIERLLVGPRAAPLASEPSLAFTAGLEGSLNPTGLAAKDLPVGSVELTAGEDRLVLRLPAEGRRGETQPFELSLSGDAARWYRRAAIAAADAPSAEQLALAGKVELAASGLASPTAGRLDRLNVVLSPLSLDTAALGSGSRVRLANERLELSAEARWDTAAGAVEVPEGTFMSSAVSARIRGVNVSMANLAGSSGEVAFRTDMARLAAWTPPIQGPLRWQTGGGLEGSLRLRGVPEGLNVVADVRGDRLALVDRQPDPANRTAPPKTVWHEPTLRVGANAIVETVAASDGRPASFAVDLREVRVESDSLRGSGGGRIEDVVAMRGVQLGGGVDYDLAKLTPMLWPSVGDGVRLVGRDRATFRLASEDSAPADAPPVRRLRAEVAAPWEGADVFGLPIGPGRLSARMQQGVVNVDPLDVAVGQGRLTATAAATLDPPPAALSLQPGPLVTDVAISREVSDKALKYIAPVFADAARVEGRFSLNLSELAVPLAQPAGAPPQGRAAGQLQVHAVRVTPGPTVAQWISLVRQIEGAARDGVQGVVAPGETTLVSIENQAIDFQLVDGRVYHRGLEFNVGDAVVQSTGSVGVDETLDLVLSVPILDEWIDRRPTLLGRLRGQSLQIPVRGTFSRPQVDNRAFTQLSGQLLQGAAAGAIESGLNKLFERLQSR